MKIIKNIKAMKNNYLDLTEILIYNNMTTIHSKNKTKKNNSRTSIKFLTLFQVKSFTMIFWDISKLSDTFVKPGKYFFFTGKFPFTVYLFIFFLPLS